VDDESYRRGLEFLERTNPRGARAMAEHAKIAPDLERITTEYTYGTIYERPGLDLRERQIATIAMLTTLGSCDRQLEAHVHTGLDAGLTKDQVVEILIHAMPFAGIPRVLNAFYVVRKVLEDRQEGGES
jgi:4-carboxymuconolactone decarboxylase